MPIDLPHVLSVNIGRPMWERIPRGQPTGIGKQPVDVIHVRDPGPKRVVDGAGVSASRSGLTVPTYLRARP